WVPPNVISGRPEGTRVGLTSRPPRAGRPAVSLTSPALAPPMRDMIECATTNNVLSLIPSVPPFASAAMRRVKLGCVMPGESPAVFGAVGKVEPREIDSFGQ